MSQKGTPKEKGTPEERRYSTIRTNANSELTTVRTYLSQTYGRDYNVSDSGVMYNPGDYPLVGYCELDSNGQKRPATKNPLGVRVAANRFGTTVLVFTVGEQILMMFSERHDEAQHLMKLGRVTPEETVGLDPLGGSNSPVPTHSTF